jgi:hypothetical protein
MIDGFKIISFYYLYKLILTRGADHYFADYIKPPKWAAKMAYQAKVGRHLFYKM